MRYRITMLVALAGVMAWTGCENAEPEFVPAQQEELPAWTLTIQAEHNDGPMTKGLGIEGDEATTTLLKSIWKSGEQVKVYLGSSCIGTLLASPDGKDAHKATLSGTVNVANITPNSTRLTLLTPRESWDYTEQIGKLLLSDHLTQSIEKKYHYTMASDVLVTGASGLSVTTENAVFSNQQSIYRLSFRYSSGPTPINAKRVTIYNEFDPFVISKVPGGDDTLGDISVSLPSPTTNPFFVALRNSNETSSDKIHFIVEDADGVTYHGTKNIPSEYKPNGTFVSIKNATLNQRLDLTPKMDPVTTIL